MRIYHIAKKEILQTLRDWRMLMVLFLAPILQLIIFGYAATYDINFIPAAVIDYDRSSASRKLVETIAASGYFSFAFHPEDQGSLTELIDRGLVWCGLVIPSDFDTRLKRGQTATVQAILDGSNSNTAGIVAAYLGRIVQNHGAKLSAEYISGLLNSGDSALPQASAVPRIEPETRAWFNPTLSSRVYNVPAVLIMIMLVVTMMLTSMAVVKEKELGTIEQISVTPIKSIELMLGKILPFVTIGVIDILAVTTVAILWFKVPFLGSIWTLLLCSFVFMLTTLGTGLLISTFSSTQQQAMMTAFLFIMPFVILSGFAFPISNMPREIQYITIVNPVRHFVGILRAIFLKGAGLQELSGHLLALLVIGIGVMAVSVIRFRKRVG